MEYEKYLKEDMTVYELGQLLLPIIIRTEARVEMIEQNFATREDLKKTEARLSKKIDQNYIHVNRRIDLLAEKVS